MSRGGDLDSLRRQNAVRILQLLSERPSATQAELGRGTDLSPSTVSSIVASLRASGVIEHADAEGSGRRSGGRAGQQVRIAPRIRYIVGVDVTHDTITIAVADLRREIALEQVLRHYDVAHSAERAADDITDAVRAMLNEAGVNAGQVAGVGVAMPSPADENQRTVSAPGVFPGWTGLRVAEELRSRLGVPVVVENDADVRALAEYQDGAGRGAHTMLYVLAGAGIGSGLIIDGKVKRGSHRNAGEIGHIIVGREGRFCYCGNRGCLHTIASGDAILSTLRDLSADPATYAHVGDVIAAVDKGDRVCERVVAEAGRELGRVVATVATFIDPDRIVVGGPLIAAGDVLLDPLRHEVRHATTSFVDIPVLPAQLAGREGILGALAIVPIRLEELLTHDITA